MTAFQETLKVLEIENSSICNAACPQCLRELRPGDHSWFEETFLPTEFFKDRIPKEVYQGLNKILFSGNIGDPCSAPNFIEVIKTVRDIIPDTKIMVSSNGGLRNEKFWKELAEVLGPNSEVVFAIDGLSDTNDIYRVNVSWNTLMKNVKSFIDAGGNATWQYIIFQHNQHQVEEAKALAKDLGFKNFLSKPSHRFLLDDIMGTQRLGKNNIVISAPTEEKFVHKLILKKGRSEFNMNTWLESSEDTCIECYAKKDKSLFINSLGEILPCCFLAASLFSRTQISVPDGWDTLWNLYGKDKINLKYHEWNNIIESDFFQGIEQSWVKNYQDGRLAICAGTCSNSNIRFHDPNEFDNMKNEEIN